MKQQLRYRQFTQVLMGIGAMAAFIQTECETGLYKGPGPVHLLVAAGTMLAYNTASVRHLFAPETPFKHRLLPVLLLWATIAGLWRSGPAVSLLALPLALVSWLYSRPFMILGGKPFALRQAPYLKLFLISVVWSLMGVCLPYVWHAQAPDKTGATLLLLRFMFILGITLPFDIRDASADRVQGIKTLAHVLGSKSLNRISVGMLLMMVLTALVFYNWAIVPAMPYLISGGWSILLILAPENFRRGLGYFLLLDAAILLQGILAFLLHAAV